MGIGSRCLEGRRAGGYTPPMSLSLNPCLEHLTDYPFARLRALFEGVEPPGNIEPLVLSIGEPQHRPPGIIPEILSRDLALWGKYPLTEGTHEFRAAAGDWLKRRFGLRSFNCESQILPAAGTREALFMAATLAVPGDHGGKPAAVLLPNPLYHVYCGAALAAGAEAVFLDTSKETGFLPDLDALDEALLERTALFILCSPSNPQGAVASLDYLKKAVSLARRYDFILASDECYCEIYDRAPPAGALQACEALGGGHDNVLVFQSLSKRSSAAGLRSGFVAGDPALIAAFKKLRSYGAATVPLPVLAASAALWNDDEHVAENRALYRAKLDAAEEILGDRFGFFRPGGGFFLWLDVGDGEAAAKKLWAEAGLRILPGAYLSRPGPAGTTPGDSFIRVALVHDLKTTREALRRIVTVLS